MSVSVGMFTGNRLMYGYVGFRESEPKGFIITVQITICILHISKVTCMF